MSFFKYIVFPFLTFLSSLYGEVWTNCSETFEIAAQARIIGDTVAFVTGRDVASADSAGGNAVENNFNRHPETSMKIAMAVQDETLSEEERAQKINAAIEEGKAQDEIYVATMGFAVAPGITSGYYASQSAARWAGTYTGGGMEAVKQEFRDHPIISTLDVVGDTMICAGFVKSMARIPQLVEAGQGIKITQPLTQTELPVIASSRPQQLEFGFVQEVKQLPKIGENVAETQIVKQRLQNVSQQAYDYAVDSVSNSGLKRTEVGLQAEKRQQDGFLNG